MLGPTGDPHQSEVAYGGTARFEFAFEMDDVVSASDGLVGMGRAEDSAAHNCNSHGHSMGIGLDHLGDVRETSDEQLV
ncbi:hypothetical protein GCM10027068_34680 [Prescottella soli]